MLHISTADDQTLATRSSPRRQIARGARRRLPAPAQPDVRAQASCPPTCGRSASRTAASTPGRPSTATATGAAATTPPAGTGSAFRPDRRDRPRRRHPGGDQRAPGRDRACRRLNRRSGLEPGRACRRRRWRSSGARCPAARRGSRQPAGHYWPGPTLGRLGRHRLLLATIRVWQDLNASSPARQLAGQAGRDHRVRRLRDTTSRASPAQLIAWAVKRERVRMLVYYTRLRRGWQPLRPGALPRRDRRPAQAARPAALRRTSPRSTPAATAPCAPRRAVEVDLRGTPG